VPTSRSPTTWSWSGLVTSAPPVRFRRRRPWFRLPAVVFGGESRNYRPEGGVW